MGIIASGASYFYGVQIPVVGEFVAVYGIMRVTWDVFYDLGAKYGPSTWFSRPRKSRVVQYMKQNGLYD